MNIRKEYSDKVWNGDLSGPNAMRCEKLARAKQSHINKAGRQRASADKEDEAAEKAGEQIKKILAENPAEPAPAAEAEPVAADQG